MLKTTDKNVRLVKLSTLQAIRGEDGIHIKARLTIEADLEEKEIDSLPQVAKAVKALASASASRVDEEGADTVNVTMKFKFEVMRYVFAGLPALKESVSMDGSVVNRPRVAVVKGKVALRWVIESTMNLNTHTGLASAIQDEDGVNMTTRGIQLKLALDTAA